MAPDPPQTIISLPVHTPLCRKRAVGGPTTPVQASGAHGEAAVTTAAANPPAAGVSRLLREALRPAHQASNVVFGHEAVAIVTASRPFRTTEVTKNAASSSCRALDVIVGNCSRS